MIFVLFGGRYIFPPESLEDKPEKLVTSTRLTAEQREFVEMKLFSRVEHQVDTEVLNRYYIRRLIASAAVFLLLYLFFSLVIRDPVPMVDELAIGLGGALFAWRMIAQKDCGSAIAQSEKVKRRNRIIEAVEVHDPELFEVESHMERLGALESLELSKTVFDSPSPLSDSWRERIRGELDARSLKLLEQVERKGHTSKMESRLAYDITLGRVNGVLMALARK